MNNSAFNSVDTLSSGPSYDVSGPVLAQLDSTAPRTARTHDISHLCDKGHILKPLPAESLIDERDHVYEAGFLPTGPLSVYDDRDGMWHTKVFPSSTPSSRTDAVLLDNWITNALGRRQTEAASLQVKEDLAQSVESLVPILSVALHEVVRQVTHHCAERGVTLDKIWRVYVELFQRVLKQMQQSLIDQKNRTSTVQGELSAAKEELGELRSEHPVQMHRVITDLEARFTSTQEAYEVELEDADEANTRLKKDIKTLQQELEIWYPTFEKYKESYIKHHVPEVSGDGSAPRRRSSGGGGGGEGGGEQNVARRSSGMVKSSDADAAKDGMEGEEIPPEVAIAKDFKRLLAVLAPEKRKLIGQELSFVMDPGASGAGKGGGKGDKDRKRKPQQSNANQEEQEKLRNLKEEVTQQEERIRALREDIASLEAKNTASDKASEAEKKTDSFRRMKTQKSQFSGGGNNDSMDEDVIDQMFAAKSRDPSHLKSKVIKYKNEEEANAKAKAKREDDLSGSEDADEGKGKGSGGGAEAEQDSD